MDNLEAQLERVTTAANRLDDCIKNLNGTLDITNNISKSTLNEISANLDATLLNFNAVNNITHKLDTITKNLDVYTNQANTNLDALQKVAKLNGEAVVASVRLANKLFYKNISTQTDINTTPNVGDFGIQCSLEITEVFNNFPLFPISLIVTLVIITISLGWKMYKEAKNTFK